MQSKRVIATISMMVATPRQRCLAMISASWYRRRKRNAAPHASSRTTAQPAAAATEPAAIASGSSQNKTSAVAAVKAEAEPAPPEATSNPQSYLTFYKAVQQTGAPLPPKDTPSTAPAKATAAAESAVVTTTKSATPPIAATVSPAPQVTRPAPVTGPGTIVVQIAAISREDDAVALAGALRKKNYNVFVVNNPITNDKLYHVQVGPFTSIQDAEAMKVKLTGEGYNPIVKR